MPSDRCSPKDKLLEFEGEVGHNDMMEGLDCDHLYFFSKKCKHKIVMKFCITLVSVINYVFRVTRLFKIKHI